MSNGVELTTFNGQIIGKDQYMFEVMFDYQTNTLSYDIYTNLVNQPIMQHLNIVEDEIHEGLSLYQYSIVKLVVLIMLLQKSMLKKMMLYTVYD